MAGSIRGALLLLLFFALRVAVVRTESDDVLDGFQSPTATQCKAYVDAALKQVGQNDPESQPTDEEPPDSNGDAGKELDDRDVNEEDENDANQSVGEESTESRAEEPEQEAEGTMEEVAKGEAEDETEREADQEEAGEEVPDSEAGKEDSEVSDTEPTEEGTEDAEVEEVGKGKETGEDVEVGDGEVDSAEREGEETGEEAAESEGEETGEETAEVEPEVTGEEVAEGEAEVTGEEVAEGEAEETDEEAAEGEAEETGEEAAEGETEETVEEAAEETGEEVAEGEAEETSEEETEEAEEEPIEGKTEEESEGIEGASEETSAEKASEGEPEESSDEEVPDSEPEEAESAEEVTEGETKDERHEGEAEEVEVSDAKEAGEGVTEGEADEAGEEVSEGEPEEADEKVTQDDAEEAVAEVSEGEKSTEEEELKKGEDQEEEEVKSEEKGDEQVESMEEIEVAKESDELAVEGENETTKDAGETEDKSSTDEEPVELTDDEKAAAAEEALKSDVFEGEVYEGPLVLRSRDHIGEILGLNEAAAELDLLIEQKTLGTLKELKKLYENSIRPLEQVYKYRDLSNRHFGDSEIFSKPLVLFMGPWSGGKSTIINYLLGIENSSHALRTGPEPSPAFFQILSWGDRPAVVDGTTLAADFTFSGLQKFGQGMLDRLRGVKLPNKLLEKVNIVEIPGILEVRKLVERPFPFNDACQWFIDRADIIFLVYDPSKLDVGPETEAILDQLKGRENQVRIVLNKADLVRPEELMRVQGTLIWNISPLMSSTEPPVMYSASLWSKPFPSGAPTRLLYAQELALLSDIKNAIDNRVEHKIAGARRFAVRVRNHAKMVDCYLTTYNNHRTFFSNKKKVSDDIVENPQEYHIYEGLSTLTNISRYDLPDPETYRDFFHLNALYEFPSLASTCTFFRGCPINQLDIAIAYDLPELVAKHRHVIEGITGES